MTPVLGEYYRVCGQEYYHEFEIGDVVECIKVATHDIRVHVFRKIGTTKIQHLFESEIELISTIKPETSMIYKNLKLGQIVILKATNEVGTITHIDRGEGKKNTKEVLRCDVLMNRTDSKISVKPDEIEPIDVSLNPISSIKNSELAPTSLPSLAAESVGCTPAEGTLHTVSVAFLDDRTLKPTSSKIYSFNTTADVKEGDVICLPVFRHGKDKAYIIIKRVFNKAFSFVNITNGDFYNENVNCNLMEIKTLEIQEFPKDVVAGIKIKA